MATNRKNPNAGAARPLFVAVLIAICCALGAAEALRAGDAPPAGDNKQVRIGVVRLQEIVERYNRYTYVTARFSEDYKKQIKNELDALEKIQADIKKQDVDRQDMLEMLIDEAAFKKFLGQGAELHQREIDAQLKLRDTRKLKDDLNTLMSLAVMEDIVSSVQTAAAGNQFDYVTDYFPIEKVQQHLSQAGADAQDQNSGLLLENLANRAPTLYADRSLDITETVVAHLNNTYAAKYGAGDKADPLLTQPLDTLVAGLKERQAAFEKAQASRKILPLASPIGAGYAAGVVNLQTIMTGVMKQRHYDTQIEELERNLRNLSANYQQAEQNYKSHASELQKDLQNGRNPDKARIDAVNQEGQALTTMLRDLTAQQGQAQALTFATFNMIFEQVVTEVKKQADVAGVRLVVATFSDEAAARAQNVENALAGKNMVVWYRRQGQIDLTVAVQKALADNYQRYLADMVKNNQQANPFDQPKKAKDVLLDYIQMNKSIKENQESEDKRRFELWHAYQKDVLKITPTADAGEAATGGKIVQPDPKPVMPGPINPNPINP